MNTEYTLSEALMYLKDRSLEGAAKQFLRLRQSTVRGAVAPIEIAPLFVLLDGSFNLLQGAAASIRCPHQGEDEGGCHFGDDDPCETCATRLDIEDFLKTVKA